MTIFNINPYKGVNSLTFGMDQDDVRKLLNQEFVSRKRTPDSLLPYDFFPKLGMFVYYKPPGLIEAFEFSKDSEVELDGVNLFSLTHEDLVKFLRERDPDLEIDVIEATSKIDGITSKKLGVGAWTPNADENEPAESIIVFEQGYYDSVVK